ncbi:MAG: hypothetical protein EBU90_06505 [Proteobacteria bacterium]|nr:hypothetical protein [Pseudomonadota bacterium]
MLPVFKCRRSIVAIVAIGCLTALGLSKGIDVSSAIAMVAMGVAGANSAEHVFNKKSTNSKNKKN